MHSMLVALGLGIAAMTLAAILWSIAFPARRISATDPNSMKAVFIAALL